MTGNRRIFLEELFAEQRKNCKCRGCHTYRGQFNEKGIPDGEGCKKCYYINEPCISSHLANNCQLAT